MFRYKEGTERLESSAVNKFLLEGIWKSDFKNCFKLTLMASASYKKHNEKNVLAECAAPEKQL